MKIRFAEKSDIEILSACDKHIRITELESSVSLGRVIVAEDNGILTGWLRWNLFWDNTPFMNMLFILEPYRSCGYGRKMAACRFRCTPVTRRASGNYFCKEAIG